MNNTKQNSLFSVNNLVKIALLSAIAAILMAYFEIPVPFFPPFLKLDISEIPALIGILAVNPLAGIIIVIIKNLLKLAIKGSGTGGVGELANAVLSIAYILPITIVAYKKKNVKNITLGLVAGTVVLTIAASFMNYFVLVPMYAKLFGGMEAVLGASSAVCPLITSPETLILYGIAPFNIFKGVIVTIASVVILGAMKPVIKQLKVSQNA